MTILEYLKSKTQIALSEDTYEGIIAVRLSGLNLDSTDDLSDIPVKERELMTADLYCELHLYPTQTTRSITDAGFSQSESTQNGNRDAYLDIALAIYKKYDDDQYTLLTELNSIISGVKITPKW